MRVLRHISHGLQNIWYWLPVIWADRQWDQHFFIEILRHKLHAMEKFFETDGPMGLEVRNRMSREIKYCRILAKRIVDNEYLENTLRYHEEIYGVAEMVWDRSNNELIGYAVPALSDRQGEAEKKARDKLYREVSRQEDADYKILFTLIRQNVRGWWD